MSYMDKGETPELTYALIQRAVHGDKAALEMILRHFDAYINAVSTVEKTLPSGETIEEVDEDMASTTTRSGRYGSTPITSWAMRRTSPVCPKPPAARRTCPCYWKRQ